MSDNTQPPYRAFRGPNAAVTSYVNTVHRSSKFPQNTVLCNSQQTDSIWQNYIIFFSTDLLLLHPRRIIYVHFPYLKVT
jgi:hypothetical protein